MNTPHSGGRLGGSSDTGGGRAGGCDGHPFDHFDSLPEADQMPWVAVEGDRFMISGSLPRAGLPSKWTPKGNPSIMTEGGDEIVIQQTFQRTKPSV